VPKVRHASRTDAGVHALCNAFTFDTIQNLERKEYPVEILRKGINHWMIMNKH
jgi:tRNA U38,U39,U40 pseudouridine synthase TruA